VELTLKRLLITAAAACAAVLSTATFGATGGDPWFDVPEGQTWLPDEKILAAMQAAFYLPSI
jgi:hypothetical protein